MLLLKHLTLVLLLEHLTLVKYAQQKRTTAHYNIPRHLRCILNTCYRKETLYLCLETLVKYALLEYYIQQPRTLFALVRNASLVFGNI